MNFIAIIILVTIIMDLVINGIADYLNIKNLQDRLPEEFEGIYHSEKYKKSQAYLKVNTRFGWVKSILNLALILIFWFGKGFPLLDHWVRSISQDPLISGVLYIGVLMLGANILSLPFSIYATFVIEERFGFNKTSWSTFIKDQIKGLLLGAFLGIPLLLGVLAFFQYTGNHAWWLCWVMVTLYMLLVQFVAPTWIMPIFNKFTTLENGELKQAIIEYAKSIDFPLKNIFIMDGSRRSSKSNAFFTGFGQNKRIVLFDNLIEQHTTTELLAVLAHEMGHYKKKHVLFMLVLGVLQTGLVFILLSFFISYPDLFHAFYMDHISVYSGLLFFAMVYSPIDFLLGIQLQILSRKNEYQADRYAAETTNDPQALTDALKKLSVHNLSNLTPHPFYVFFNYSHPPVLDRIRALDH